jgi:hypothetical protein
MSEKEEPYGVPAGKPDDRLSEARIEHTTAGLRVVAGRWDQGEEQKPNAPLYYSVARYVADPLKQEQVVVGIVIWTLPPTTALIKEWSRVCAFTARTKEHIINRFYERVHYDKTPTQMSDYVDLSGPHASLLPLGNLVEYLLQAYLR